MSKTSNMLWCVSLALFAAASTPSIAQSNPQGICERYIYGCDADANEFVDLTEWEACDPANGPTIFGIIDVNQDGQLSCPEVLAFFS